jgi:phenylacetate-CoA ligase
MMHDAFGCPILEHYGSVEFGNMAQTDPEGYLRINEDMVLIETLPTGEVAITKLLGHAYPFIRYKLGDMMSLATEPIGQLPYARIERIAGRVADLIVLRGGDYIAGLELNKAVRPHEQFVRKYQIRQTAVDEFLIRIVPSQPLPDHLQRRIVSEMRQLVGDDATVRIDLVDDIPPEKSGKFRAVVSDVAEAERVAAIAAGAVDRQVES